MKLHVPRTIFNFTSVSARRFSDLSQPYRDNRKRYYPVFEANMQRVFIGAIFDEEA